MALLVFTIFVQAAIGVMAFVTIGKLVNKDDTYKSSILTSAGLSIVGLLASLMHLGRPFSAVNALARFGSSLLSREIWFTGAFAGLTIIIALLIVFKPST
jgi:anaerobic dimethyl sulfoxide reductase subunit C (anchor subunit)